MSNSRHPEQFRVHSLFSVEGKAHTRRQDHASGPTQLGIVVARAILDGAERIDVTRIRDGQVVMRYDIDGFDL